MKHGRIVTPKDYYLQPQSWAAFVGNIVSVVPIFAQPEVCLVAKAEALAAETVPAIRKVKSMASAAETSNIAGRPSGSNLPDNLNPGRAKYLIIAQFNQLAAGV